MKWILLIAIFTFTTLGTDEKFRFSCCSRLKDKKVEDLGIAKWACWNCISLNQPYLQKCEICKQPKFIQLNTCMAIYTIWTKKLSDAASNGNEEYVCLLLNAFPKEENKTLIEFLISENDINIGTALHWASYNGSEKIVKLLMKAFPEEEKDKLIEYVMKENEIKYTALHLSSLNGYEKIVKLLLNVFTTEREKDKLIEYVMKESTKKITALHFASYSGHEKIVKLLLNVFGKDNNKQLIKYLMKEDEDKYTASHLASAQENHKIVKLLFQKQNNAIILRDLQKVIQIFNKQNEDQKENSPLWYLFEDNRCGLGKEIILKFLITDYNRHIHFI